jgi:hypothetical protein
VIYCELLGAEDFDVDHQSLESIECREKIDQLQSQINFMNEDYEKQKKMIRDGFTLPGLVAALSRNTADEEEEI